jgi:hypothetical protein
MHSLPQIFVRASYRVLLPTLSLERQGQRALYAAGQKLKSRLSRRCLLNKRRDRTRKSLTTGKCPLGMPRCGGLWP